MSGSQTREILQQLSHRHLRFLLFRYSRFPSFMLPLCTLHFRTLKRFCRKSALGTSGILATFAQRHRTKEKKILERPETRSLAPLPHLSDGLCRDDFPCCSWLSWFPFVSYMTKIVRLKCLKMELMAFVISLWIFSTLHPLPLKWEKRIP